MSETGEMGTNGPVTFISAALGLGHTVPCVLEPIHRGGSGRSFFRCRIEGRSFVLMRYGLKRRENAYYVPIARFLAGASIPVPQIIANDPEQRLILMEDLGGDDLWSRRAEPWQRRRAFYAQTLAVAARLHALAPASYPGGAAALMPGFDAALYLWEREYFRQQFVEGICGISLTPAQADALEAELSALADQLLQCPARLVHRDLQSQNVMIKGGSVVLIDFQGMRPGNPLYDVASLLYDPYVSLGEGERLVLLQSYARATACRLRRQEFLQRFHEAAVQRLMQALGAYGFLGRTQGKSAFLAHIPRGLAHLEEAAARCRAVPRLQELLARCRAVVSARVP